jgi:hypothetical protein
MRRITTICLAALALTFFAIPDVQQAILVFIVAGVIPGTQIVISPLESLSIFATLFILIVAAVTAKITILIRHRLTNSDTGIATQATANA